MRINLVPPKILADQHLFAEWREIKMAPQMLRRTLRTRSVNETLSRIGKKYTLNKGHGLFFYDKMRFLNDRYNELTEELDNRGYKLTYHDTHFVFYRDIPEVFRTKEWLPNTTDVKINVERILLRISEKPDWYKYQSEALTASFYKKYEV